MHHQMHRTDVVPELAIRQSMSLVVRSKNSIDQSPSISCPSTTETDYSSNLRAYHDHLKWNRLADHSPNI